MDDAALHQRVSAVYKELACKEAAEKAAHKARRAAERARKRAAGQRERNKTAQADYRERYREQLRAARSVASALMGLWTGSNPAHTTVYLAAGGEVSPFYWIAERLRACLSAEEIGQLRKELAEDVKAKRDRRRARTCRRV